MATKKTNRRSIKRRPCCGAIIGLPYIPVGCPRCNPEFWRVR